MNREDFIAKIDWEGGILGALDYGLRSEDCDDPELKTTWQQLETWYNNMPKEAEEIIVNAMIELGY